MYSNGFFEAVDKTVCGQMGNQGKRGDKGKEYRTLCGVLVECSSYLCLKPIGG